MKYHHIITVQHRITGSLLQHETLCTQ